MYKIYRHVSGRPEGRQRISCFQRFRIPQSAPALEADTRDVTDHVRSRLRVGVQLYTHKMLLFNIPQYTVDLQVIVFEKMLLISYVLESVNALL